MPWGKKGEERANLPCWSTWIYFLFILGLDGLIFFVNCVLGLWLKLLVAHWCFGCCWASLAWVSRLPGPPWWVGWGGQRAGRGCGWSQLAARMFCAVYHHDQQKILRGLMGWLEGACCLGFLGISLFVGVGEWWKTALGGLSSSVYSLLNKLCLFNPYIALLFLFSPMSHRCGSCVSRGCKISICCLGLSHCRVHNFSNISFCICNDAILNMVFKGTTHHL